MLHDIKDQIRAFSSGRISKVKEAHKSIDPLYMVKKSSAFAQLVVYNSNGKKKSIIFLIDGFENLYLALCKCDRVTLDGVRKIKFCTKNTSELVL